MSCEQNNNSALEPASLSILQSDVLRQLLERPGAAARVDGGALRFRLARAQGRPPRRRRRRRAALFLRLRDERGDRAALDAAFEAPPLLVHRAAAEDDDDGPVTVDAADDEDQVDDLA